MLFVRGNIGEMVVRALGHKHLAFLPMRAQGWKKLESHRMYDHDNLDVPSQSRTN